MGMDIEDVVRIYNRELLSHKKEWNNAICSNMDRPKDYHIKWSKSRDKYQVLSLIYMWNLKYDRNELIYKTQTDSETQETNLRLQKKKDGGRHTLGAWH